MQELPPGTTLAPEEVDRLISRSAAGKLLQESIADELSPTEHQLSRVPLTVAVCTRDRVDLLAACLDRLVELRNHRPIGSPAMQILVVDNASSNDATRHHVASLPRVDYVRESRPGLDFARNRAIQEATGEFLAFLDDDVEVDRGWLEGLEEALAENGDAAAVTGLVLPYELETEAQVIFERRGGFRRGCEKIRYAGQSLPGNAMYPAGAGIFGAGCNMAFRREVLRALGGFDEALDTGSPLPGGGDLDIFYRVVRAGYPLVYEPRMLVFHKHRREYAALRRQFLTWGTGFMAFLNKTYRSDLNQRLTIRSLIVWWYKAQLAELIRVARGKSPMKADLIVWEMAGGAAGLLWMYPKSLRRTEKIRECYR
jgi:GT2 family glycosyltransferase